MTRQSLNRAFILTVSATHASYDYAISCFDVVFFVHACVGRRVEPLP